MERKNTWNLEDIFKDQKEFDDTKNALEKDLEKIQSYQGKLCGTSENLYECYYLYEKALEKFEKLYAYGMLFYHLDMANQEGIKRFKEVEALSTTFSTATSFMTPQITYEKKETIEKYLKENKKLQRYRRDIYDILEEKDHILSKEEEAISLQF